MIAIKQAYNSIYIPTEQKGIKEMLPRMTADGRPLPASLTLEAALTLPLLITVLYGFFFFFLAIVLHIRMQSALDRVGQKLAAWFYIVEQGRDRLMQYMDHEEGEKDEALPQIGSWDISDLGSMAVDMVMAETVVKAMLTDVFHGQFAGEEVVEGGTGGISMLASYYDRNTKVLHLRATYTILFPLFTFPRIRITVVQRSAHRAWVGKPFENPPEQKYVYVTDTGKVYHTSLSCSYLKLTIKEVPLSSVDSRRNSDGARYHECERCGKGEGATVFLTSCGDAYHSNRNCPGLKRTVNSVPEEETNLPICTRCRSRS